MAKRTFAWGATWLTESIYSQRHAYEAVMGKLPPEHDEDSLAYKQFQWTPQRKRSLGTAEDLSVSEPVEPDTL